MFHPGAIKTTARQLVQNRLGVRPVKPQTFRKAVEDVLFKGWLPNWLPNPDDYDRSIIFIPQWHRYGAIFRCLGRDGIGAVPRGLIESRTQARLHHLTTGVWLATYGLAILRVEGNIVILRGTSSGMASCVNFSRYSTDRRRRCEVLVSHVTGLSLRPEVLDDDLRLRAALEYDAFALDVPGLLNGEDDSEVISRWQFPPSAAPLKNLDPPF